MDKEIARRVSESVLNASEELGRSVGFVRDNCSEAELLAYADVISKVMHDLWVRVLKPIYVEHPDLEPPELKP
jgi:hypothetical protein